MPEQFNRCVRNGGRVRRVRGPSKQHGLGPREYQNFCFIKGQSYAGEIHHVTSNPVPQEDVDKVINAYDKYENACIKEGIDYIDFDTWAEEYEKGNVIAVGGKIPSAEEKIPSSGTTPKGDFEANAAYKRYTDEMKRKGRLEEIEPISVWKKKHGF